MHDEVHDEMNLCTSRSCTVLKILRRTTFSWTCFEEYGLSCTQKPNFSSPAVTFFFCFGDLYEIEKHVLLLSAQIFNEVGRIKIYRGSTRFILIAFNACRKYLTPSSPPFCGYSFNISGLCLIKSDSLTQVCYTVSTVSCLPYCQRCCVSTCSRTINFYMLLARTCRTCLLVIGVCVLCVSPCHERVRALHAICFMC